MTNKEAVERNIGLTFDLIRQAIKDPSLLDKISNGIIEFIEKDFSKLVRPSGGKETKTSVKPSQYLKVSTQFSLVAEPEAKYGKKR